MQTSVVFISFQDTKINRTFVTPLHTLNIQSSYFGTSAQTTNFAQVEHNFKKKSNQNLCKAPKKTKKLTPNKYFSHPSLIIYLFPTQPKKLKWGLNSGIVAKGEEVKNVSHIQV
jgi:hypothetical protein